MRKSTAAAATAALTALALSFGGCAAGPQSAASNTATAAGGNKVLKISGWSGDEVMAALVEEFKKENPGVTVELSGLPWPQILTTINTQLTSGTAADVVVVFPGNGNPITAQTLAKGNYLQDLSAQSWVSKFSDVNKKVMGANGKILMVSNNFTIIPATYNTKALAAVGKKAPTTWTEVMELCTAATAKGKVAFALAGLAGGTYNYFPYALTSTLVDGPNPDFAAQQAAGQVSFSNSPWTDALTKYSDMVNAGCFTKDATGTSLEVAQGQVAKGDAVGIVTVSNQIGDIQKAAPSGSTFETAALPATDDPSQTVLPVGLGAGYGVNAKGNVELANKFMEFYMSEKGLNIALKSGSIFPTVPVAGFTPIPTLTGVAEQVQGGKTAAFPDQTWPNSNVNKVYGDQVQKLIGGKTTVQDALAAMDAAYSA